MKKSISLCITAWLLLAVSIIAAYKFARSIDPKMEAPQFTAVSAANNGVTLKWTPVEYASSYSIHKKPATSGKWQFLEAVSSDARSYLLEEPEAGYVYSVRSCNYSLGVFHWSEFSAAVSADADAGGVENAG